MNEQDLGWDDVPDQPYYAAHSRQQLVEWFSAHHSRRWNRLKKDHAWLRREMEKMGLNPEDARFLL